MEIDALRALVAMAFGMGMIHALDADHVMAVTTLASGRPRLSRTLGYATRWALGHAFSLTAIALLWLGLGIRLPDWVAHGAEWSVAVLLVGMGTGLLFTLWRKRLRIGFHTHPGLPAHAHWHADTEGREAPSHRHRASMIGALHGVAGSAPLLALVPAITQGDPRWAMAHLGVFSLGMLLAMLACGGALGGLTARLSARGAHVGSLVLRSAIGLCAIGVGIDLGLGLLH